MVGLLNTKYGAVLTGMKATPQTAVGYVAPPQAPGNGTSGGISVSQSSPTAAPVYSTAPSTPQAAPAAKTQIDYTKNPNWKPLTSSVPTAAATSAAQTAINGISASAMPSMQALADKYSGGDLLKFASTNQDMFKNTLASVNAGDVTYGAGGTEIWNPSSPNRPGSAPSFLSGKENPMKYLMDESGQYILDDAGNKQLSLRPMAPGGATGEVMGVTRNPDGSYSYTYEGQGSGGPDGTAGLMTANATSSQSTSTNGANVSGVPYTNVGANRRSDSVMDRVMDYTAQDSPIMRQAMTQGAKFGNARGLLNSSMAGQAAQEAVINAAVPIASQEASQAMQTNLADANRELELMMQQNQIDLADRQQIRQIASTEGMAQADRYMQDLLKQRDILYGTEQANLNRSLEADLAKLNLNQSAKQLLLGTANNLEAIRADKIANINANGNLDADTRAQMVAAAQKEFEDAWTFAKDLASVRVEY